MRVTTDFEATTPVRQAEVGAAKTKMTAQPISSK